MGNDGGVSCASCVMTVMAMTVNCGGNDGVIDGDNVVRSPSPTGPLRRAFRKHIFRPRGTAKPVLLLQTFPERGWCVDPLPRAPVGANCRPGFAVRFSGRWRALAKGTARAVLSCNLSFNYLLTPAE